MFSVFNDLIRACLQLPSQVNEVPNDQQVPDQDADWIVL